jgi:Protein of unknown function (DUF3237)
MSNIDRSTPGLRKWFVLQVELAALASIGPNPAGEIRLIPIIGGHFSGHELEGIVLPGGADWQTLRSDGCLEISARYLLQTNQGELIEVRSDGVRSAAPTVSADQEPAAPYFRTGLRFRTASERLAKLNDRLAISYGIRLTSSVQLEVYEVL